MPGRVKKRTYGSPARQAKAAATRARIIDAAARLFLERGYARTSTAAIGKAAQTSEASVFAVFGATPASRARSARFRSWAVRAAHALQPKAAPAGVSIAHLHNPAVSVREQAAFIAGRLQRVLALGDWLPAAATR